MMLRQLRENLLVRRRPGLSTAEDGQRKLLVENLSELGIGVHVELPPGESMDFDRVRRALDVHFLLDAREHTEVDLHALSLHLREDGDQRQLDLPGELGQTGLLDLGPKQDREAAGELSRGSIAVARLLHGNVAEQRALLACGAQRRRGGKLYLQALARKV